MASTVMARRWGLRWQARPRGGSGVRRRLVASPDAHDPPLFVGGPSVADVQRLWRGSAVVAGAERTARPRRARSLRLLLLLPAVVLLFWPALGAAQGSGVVGNLLGAGSSGGVVGGPGGGPAAISATVLAMLGALLAVAPVAGVYALTRGVRGADRSVLQTILLLPVAVAGIVMVVQNSLALAFSLAGIVAAVRFRSTLRDTKDAVYLFVAIGVGVAAGSLALTVAAAMSLVFAATVLALSRLVPAGDGATPSWQGGAGKAEPTGNGAVPRAAGLLVVRAQRRKATQRAVEAVLSAHVKQRTPAEVERHEDGTATLRYWLRLKRRSRPSELLATLTALGERRGFSVDYLPLPADGDARRASAEPAAGYASRI